MGYRRPGNLGELGGACSDAYSDACEETYCPSFFSRRLCIISCTDAQKKCHKYLSDKEAGMLVSTKDLERAAQLRRDEARRQQEAAKSRAEVERATRARAEAERRLEQAEAVNRRSTALQEKAGKNTKFVMIGAGVLLVLGVGAFALSKKGKR